MTDKSRIVIIIVVALAIILAATAFAYSRYKKRIEKEASGGPHTVERPTQEIKVNQKYYFEDVLDSQKLLGKAVNDCGIDEKYFSESVTKKLDFDGKLFGTDANGTIFVDDGTFSERVYINSYVMNFDTAVEKLTEVFGEPTATGEEPFARAKGGAVSWADFRKGGIKITLSSGSENNFIEITIKTDAES